MSAGLWVWWILIEESMGIVSMVSWFAVGLIEEELVKEGRVCILVKEKAKYHERVLLKERIEHHERAGRASGVLEKFYYLFLFLFFILC